MNKQKVIISPKAIRIAVLEEGKRIKRKEELHKNIKKIEEELEKLNEASMGMAGSFGFVGDKSDIHKHGFVDDQFQNISNIARLEAEFAESDEKQKINEDIIDENAKLKKQIEELKSQIENKK